MTRVDWSSLAEFRGASLLFDDGHGKSLVTVATQAAAPIAGTAVLVEHASYCRQPGVSCRFVAGGLLIIRTTASPAVSDAVLRSVSAIYVSGGWGVTVTAYNAMMNKRGRLRHPMPRPTRAEPALTGAQVAEIAMDPVWLD